MVSLRRSREEEKAMRRTVSTRKPSFGDVRETGFTRQPHGRAQWTGSLHRLARLNAALCQRPDRSGASLALSSSNNQISNPQAILIEVAVGEKQRAKVR